MDFFSFPPVAAVFGAAYGALMRLADILEPLAGAGAAALAVVLVTLLVRAALIPVGIAQAKAEQGRSRLAPRIRVLQERHRTDPERLQRELRRLYADENTSPLAGCLPLLAQAPVVGLIYALFLHPTIAGHANALLGHQLLGVPLGTSAVSALTGGAFGPASALVFGAIVLVIVAVAEVTRRVFRPPQTDAARPAPAMLRVAGALQFTTAVFALFVPLAAAIYLAVTVTWTLVQRVILRRRFPLHLAAA